MEAIEVEVLTLEDQPQPLPSGSGNSKGVKKWSDSETKAMLAEYQAVRSKVGKCLDFKNKRKIWPHIAEKLNSSFGTNVTPKQVENRFTTLERGLKTVHDNNRRTGRGRINCAYQKELEDMMGKRPSIDPPYLLWNKETDGTRREDPENIQREIEEEDEEMIAGIVDTPNTQPSPLQQRTAESNNATSSTPRRRNKKNTIVSELRAFRLLKEEMFRETTALLRERNELLKEQNEILKKLC